MIKPLRIGTRESQLAVWQAAHVQQMLAQHGFESELVFIKSEGDIDIVTPLYEIGVQGIFTKTLDAALLSKKIDVAVHSMKDVPVQLAGGIAQAAVLKRASHKDILVYKGEWSMVDSQLQIVSGKLNSPLIIATSSIRRKAQWLHRYPNIVIENLRGNVNTRLKKLEQNNWQGAIFAAAGLERINLRPENSIDLDWMLPAPAQGAIMVVCNEEDNFAKEACNFLNDDDTAFCTRIERDFLKALLGGCSAPIGALAVIENETVKFKGNILSPDGKQKLDIEKMVAKNDAADSGIRAASEILNNRGNEIMKAIRNEGK